MKSKVYFPVYIQNNGETTGKIIRATISSEKNFIKNNYTVLFQKTIDNSLNICQEYILSKLPTFIFNDYKISFFGLSENEVLDGSSAGLAFFILFCSYFLEIEVHNKYFFTGELWGTKIKNVGGIKEKLNAVKEKSDDYIFFIPAENEFRNSNKIIKVNNIEEVISIVFEKEKINNAIKKLPTENINSDKIIEIADKKYKKNEWKSAEFDYKRILSFYENEKLTNQNIWKLFKAYWRLGSIATHYGKLPAVKKYFDLAEEILNQDDNYQISSKDIAGYYNSKIIGYYFDYFMFDDAKKYTEINLKKIQRQPAVKVKTLGTYAQVLIHLKEYEKGEEVLLNVIDLAEDKYKSQDYIYLVNLKIKQKQYDMAEIYLSKAIEYTKFLKNKNVQNLYNYLSHIKICYFKKYKIDDAFEYLKKISVLYDGVIDNGLYPKGIAEFYFAKICFENGYFNDGLLRLESSYVFLEKLDSININIIASCFRLYENYIYFKSNLLNDVKIEENLKIFKSSIDVIESVKNYYNDNYKNLKLSYENKNINDIFKITNDILNKNPYI